MKIQESKHSSCSTSGPASPRNGVALRPDVEVARKRLSVLGQHKKFRMDVRRGAKRVSTPPSVVLSFVFFAAESGVSGSSGVDPFELLVVYHPLMHHYIFPRNRGRRSAGNQSMFGFLFAAVATFKSRDALHNALSYIGRGTDAYCQSESPDDRDSLSSLACTKALHALDCLERTWRQWTVVGWRVTVGIMGLNAKVNMLKASQNRLPTYRESMVDASDEQVERKGGNS
ncbi:hypothetical protein BDZ89DRAFT_1035377 [Hymenopellis radicata]|nr:hypothetical protein BDZ89DRAFT_1035377 [Hymenopellis radicata]